jgi:hypothetical protein
LNKEEKIKTLENVEDKKGNNKNEKFKQIVKNNVKQFNNSDDRLSLDSIISNELEANKNKITKTDSAKTICDEFTKIVKGTLGNTLKNLANNGFQKNINLKTNIFEENSEQNKKVVNRKDTDQIKIKDVKKHNKNQKNFNKSCSTLSSMSINSNESIIDSIEDEFNEINKRSKTNMTSKDPKIINKTECLINDRNLKKKTKNKLKKDDSTDNRSKNTTQISLDQYEKRKQEKENFRKNQLDLLNKKETPPPRPAPPRRPPPPRPMSPNKFQSKQSQDSSINKSEKKNIDFRIKTKQSNLPPRPPLPPPKSKKLNSEEMKPNELNESAFYDIDEIKSKSRENKKSYDKHKINLSSSSTSRSNSLSPSEISIVNLKNTNGSKQKKAQSKKN